MPSVPKYFRAMCPRTRKKRPRWFNVDDRSIGRIVQNKGGFSARMANSRGADAGGLVRNFYYFLFLSRRPGAGCVTLTGSEAGKLSSRPCSSERSSLRLRASSASRFDFSSLASSTTLCFGPAMEFSLQAARLPPPSGHNACAGDAFLDRFACRPTADSPDLAVLRLAPCAP